VTAGPDAAPARVAILAEDLIWATRLADIVRRAGGVAVPLRAAGSEVAIPRGIDGLVVDLTARSYDGVAAIGVASAAGVPVVAVGQHDDATLRRAARAAGAAQVYAYRPLFEHGDRDLGAWIVGLADDSEETR
jgi:hypothetical protein